MKPSRPSGQGLHGSFTHRSLPFSPRPKTASHGDWDDDTFHVIREAWPDIFTPIPPSSPRHPYAQHLRPRRPATRHHRRPSPPKSATTPKFKAAEARTAFWEDELQPAKTSTTVLEKQAFSLDASSGLIEQLKKAALAKRRAETAEQEAEKWKVKVDVVCN